MPLNLEQVGVSQDETPMSGYWTCNLKKLTHKSTMRCMANKSFCFLFWGLFMEKIPFPRLKITWFLPNPKKFPSLYDIMSTFHATLSQFDPWELLRLCHTSHVWKKDALGLNSIGTNKASSFKLALPCSLISSNLVHLVVWRWGRIWSRSTCSWHTGFGRGSLRGGLDGP